MKLEDELNQAEGELGSAGQTNSRARPRDWGLANLDLSLPEPIWFPPIPLERMRCTSR